MFVILIQIICRQYLVDDSVLLISTGFSWILEVQPHQIYNVCHKPINRTLCADLLLDSGCDTLHANYNNIAHTAKVLFLPFLMGLIAKNHILI